MNSPRWNDRSNTVASSLPLFKQVRDSLKEDIRREVWKVGERIPSERELAKKYGVSRITINKALAELIAEKWVYAERGRGTFVSSRDKNADQRKTTSICLLSPHAYSELDFYSGFFLDTVNAIRNRIEGKYELVMYSSEWNADREKMILQNMVADHIAGLIVFPLVNEENEALNHESYLKIMNLGIPIVFIYRQPKNLKISSVSYDTRALFEIILDRMKDLDHIGYLAYGTKTYINKLRLQYFREVMKDINKTVDEDLIRFYHNAIHQEQIVDEINTIAVHYAQQSKLQGLICHDEMIAFLVRNQLKKHHRTDIRIVGINAYKSCLTKYLHLFGITDFKNLPSVDIKSDLIGENAIEMLFAAIEDPRLSSVQKVLLMPTLE